MKLKSFVYVLFCSLCLALPLKAQGEDVVAVAAGIAPSVQEVMDLYVSKGNEALSMVTGPCGALAKQTEAGAGYDMVLLSEPRWPQWMAEKGLLLDLDTFAIGQLVLWSPKDDVPSLSAMKDKTVAIPDPESTAYGGAAKSYLVSMDLWDEFLKGKTIPTKSAPQAVVAAKSGSAQWAFIPMASALKARGKYIVLEGAVLPQVGGLAPGAGQNAKAFWEFCRSPEADAIWLKWGFHLVKK